MSDSSKYPIPDDLKELECFLDDLKPEALDSVSKGRLSTAIIHAKPEVAEDIAKNSSEQRLKKLELRQRIIAFAGGLAAAAAVAVMFLVGGGTAPQAKLADGVASELVEPLVSARIPANAREISSESMLREVVDDGIILTEASTRMRQVRTLYKDTVSWTDPVSEARLELSFNREELFLIPIDAI